MSERAERDMEERLREWRGMKLYWRRCGWCGAYEGTVDAKEPCPRATATFPGETMRRHQPGPLEDASAVLDLVEQLREERDDLLKENRELNRRVRVACQRWAEAEELI